MDQKEIENISKYLFLPKFTKLIINSKNSQFTTLVKGENINFRHYGTDDMAPFLVNGDKVLYLCLGKNFPQLDIYVCKYLNKYKVFAIHLCYGE
jgi:hypothetical protein